MQLEGCKPPTRCYMSRKSHPSLHGPTCTSILHFGRIPIQMGLATLCPKHAKSAAQSIPNHPPKPGVSSSTNPNMEYRRLKSRDNPHSHTLFYRRYDHTEPIPFFLSLSYVMFLCISQSSHAVHQPKSKKRNRLAVSYNIGIVMLDQAQELPCIPSVTQGLRSFFCRQNHPADEAPENWFGRNRRADTFKRERRATIPAKFRGGRRPISPSSIRQPRPVSFPCLLPRLSFGEALPDGDELFSSVSGSSNPTSLPPDQSDRTADPQGQRTQADEYREECVSQHPMEHARVDTSPLSTFAQSPPHQTQDTALLETCIRATMSPPEIPERRRGRTRTRRVFDEPRTQPIPLLAEGSHGGYSLFPSPRQRTGNSSTPPALIPRPEPEHPQAKARLDSAALPASVDHQAEDLKAKPRLNSGELPKNPVSALDPLEEDVNRDSAAFIPGKPAPVTGSTDQSNARAVPVGRPNSHDTSVTEEVSPPVLDQPAILAPTPSEIRSQPASHTLRPARTTGPPSLRTSKTMRCRPATANRPQQKPQPSDTVAAANCSSSRDDGSPIVDGPSSPSILATSSPSPQPVSPCDLAGKGNQSSISKKGD